MHARTPQICLTLLLVLGACSTGGTLVSGNHHTWLTTAPMRAPDGTTAFAVSTHPAGDLTAELLKARIVHELEGRGYDVRAANEAVTIHCRIRHHGNPKPSAAGSTVPAECYDRARRDWDKGGWPSCAVFLELKVGSGPANAADVVLFTRSGATTARLTPTGHVRRTTGTAAEGDGEENAMLEPQIAQGLREALRGLFSGEDS